jgi:MtN3 and saliva related transmembrane protein
MDAVNLLGLVAGALTTSAFIPQLSKTWKSKCADDVSVSMLSIFCTGVLLWLLYGFWIHALPIILTNLATLVLASLILVLKIKYARPLKKE